MATSANAKIILSQGQTTTQLNPFDRMKDSPLKELLLKFERGALADGINIKNLVEELGKSLLSVAEKTAPQPEYRRRKPRVKRQPTS